MLSEYTVFFIKTDQTPIGPKICLNTRNSRESSTGKPIMKQAIILRIFIIKVWSYYSIHGKENCSDSYKRTTVASISKLNVTAYRLHKTIEKKNHSKYESRNVCLLNAIPFLSVHCLTKGKCKITKRLHKTANYNSDEENIHIHWSKKTHHKLPK